MKFFTLILLTFLLFTSKTGLKLELTIGDYYDDHSRRKYNYSKRKWKIEDEKLIYHHIDTRTENYADTIGLSKKQLDTLMQIIELQNLKENIIISYDDNRTHKHMRYKKEVKGKLYLNNEEYDYQIKSNSIEIEKHEKYKNLEALEQYFYELAEKK
ncbi:hypothetical protein [Bernardetia sp.]|uniref:hypothetical protein n=1 Tax=Bernardetia sp. TaxID=1937974 RepID=UPI0025B865BC|nr:hypothetical protein [Bernardetia sp.]